MVNVAPRDTALVIFDGGCGLCHRAIRFVAARDRRRAFRFAPLGGPTASTHLGPDAPTGAAAKTIILADAGRLYTESTAALRIAARLDPPWSLLAWLIVVPRPARDWVYACIARHRYRWFGTVETCGVAPAGLRDRLLD